MHKLCHPILVLSVVFAFVISACGREVHVAQSGLTEEQAFEEISTSLKSGRNAFGRVSVDGLQKLLEKLIAEGRIKLPGRQHSAVDLSQVDLSGVSQILGLITNGKTNNAFSLASQLLTLAPSMIATVQGGGSKLDIIMSILQQALPIIATVAPQFAPIAGALVVILPLVASFAKMFKKPKPSPTASLFPSLNYVRA